VTVALPSKSVSKKVGRDRWARRSKDVNLLRVCGGPSGPALPSTRLFRHPLRAVTAWFESKDRTMLTRLDENLALRHRELMESYKEHAAIACALHGCEWEALALLKQHVV